MVSNSRKQIIERILELERKYASESSEIDLRGAIPSDKLIKRWEYMGKEIDLLKEQLKVLDGIKASYEETIYQEGLSSLIVRLLQEIVVERSQQIYEEQSRRLAESTHDIESEEIISLGNKLITIKDGLLFSANPQTRYPIGWEGINDKLQQFALWQKEMDGFILTDLDIIKTKLLFLTDQIIGDVCNFLKFFTLDYRTDTPEFRFGFSGIELSAGGGALNLDARIPQETRDKAHRCNMLIYKLEKIADTIRLREWNNQLLDRTAINPSEQAQPGPQTKTAPKKRLQILLDIFKTRDDWKDRGKIDECCRQMEANQIPYPGKKGGPSGADLSKWTDLIGKKTSHPEINRLFLLRKNVINADSTIFTEWRKAMPKKRAKPANK
jgi:hypothetical protein